MTDYSYLPEDSACIPEKARDQHLAMVPDYAEPFRTQGIRGVGMHEVAPPYEIRRTGAPWHLALFTLRGRARFECLGRSGEMNAGSIWIGPANAAHRYRALGEWTFLSAAVLAGAERAHLRSICRPATESVTHLAAAAEAYLSESTRSEDQESLAARALAEYLAIVIARELALDCPPERYNRQHRMRDLWERVNAAPGATWTVDGMAHELAISSRQFQRLMHEVYRVSASEMLLRLRMQRAQELLLSTNLTLEAIAQRVGYGYVYSFCKAFKRAHGCAPGAYRKSHIEGKPQ